MLQLTHVNSDLGTAFYHTKNIDIIRNHLTHEAAVWLIPAYVTCRIDYCNALFYVCQIGIKFKHMLQSSHIYLACICLIQIALPPFCHWFQYHFFFFFFYLKNIYLNNKFVDQGYKTEKLLTALNKLAQSQSLPPRYLLYIR